MPRWSVLCGSETRSSNFSADLNGGIEKEDSIECNDGECKDCCDFSAFDGFHGPSWCGVDEEGVHNIILL